MEIEQSFREWLNDNHLSNLSGILQSQDIINLDDLIKTSELEIMNMGLGPQATTLIHAKQRYESEQDSPDDYIQSSSKYNLELLESDTLLFNEVKDKLERYVQPEHKKQLHVVRIEKVNNEELEKKFMERCDQLYQNIKAEKFHGTSNKAILSILNDGFRMPDKPGMYGKGIYFATDSSKSAQYTKSSDKLLLCNVAIGSHKTVISSDKTITLESLNKGNFDSVYAPRNTKKHGWCSV